MFFCKLAFWSACSADPFFTRLWLSIYNSLAFARDILDWLKLVKLFVKLWKKATKRIRCESRLHQFYIYKACICMILNWWRRSFSWLKCTRGWWLKHQQQTLFTFFLSVSFSFFLLWPWMFFTNEITDINSLTKIQWAYIIVDQLWAWHLESNHLEEIWMLFGKFTVCIRYNQVVNNPVNVAWTTLHLFNWRVAILIVSKF